VILRPASGEEAPALAEVHASAPADGRLQGRNWMAHDGTLWSALPRMTWALYGAGRGGQSHG